MAAPDYRVSRVAVLCKDCRQDVGLYPSRHRCQAPDAPPPVPTLPTSVPREGPSLAPPSLAPPRPGLSARTNSSSSAGSGRFAARPAAPGANSNSSLRAGAGRWARPPNTAPASRTPSSGGGGGDDYDNGNAGGGTIWGKLRAATTWNNQETPEASGSDRGEEDPESANAGQNTGGKFWGKLMGTSGNSDKSEDPDSDATDYEGESHVTRQLKAYYRERYPDAPLPGWLTNPPPELASRNNSGGTHRSTPSTHSTAPSASFGRSSMQSESSRCSQDAGQYRPAPSAMPGSSYEQPSTASREYNGASDAGPGTSPGRFAAAPAPARRPVRPRGNVRRDAGAFFDQDD